MPRNVLHDGFVIRVALRTRSRRPFSTPLLTRCVYGFWKQEREQTERFRDFAIKEDSMARYNKAKLNQALSRLRSAQSRARSAQSRAQAAQRKLKRSIQRLQREASRPLVFRCGCGHSFRPHSVHALPARCPSCKAIILYR